MLAIRAARVGDTLHVRPALQLLRSALPQAHLTLLCSEGAHAVTSGLALDACVAYAHKGRGPAAGSRRAAARRRLAEAGPYDLVLGLEDKPWGRALAQEVGASRFEAESTWGEHVVERKAGVLVSLGLYDPRRDGPPPPIRWTPSRAARDAARALLARAPRPWIYLQSGSHALRGLFGPRRRRDPHPRWLAGVSRGLRASLGGTLVLQTGTGGVEARLTRALARRLRLAGVPLLLLEGGSLEELGALIDQVDLVVSANTGPAHLAAACDTPLVLLEGPSTAAARPWRAPRVAVLNAHLPCSPCRGTAHGRACKTPVCLDLLPPARVVEAASLLLSSPV